ncbi:hypothetical protein ACFOKF_15290 [Sphingobium rhizovicinum]|uniref:Uncharacterized protein n=1 Tax=Sphingobium rhizovicinum TaxID=432308 RepID=A0ABV7NH72_9SPHN
MAIDYSIHAALASTLGGGRSRFAPILPHSGGKKGLALNTNSDPITGPCEICITPEEKVRLDIKVQVSAGTLDPAASPLVLPAGSPSWFHITTGTWIIKAAAA